MSANRRQFLASAAAAAALTAVRTGRASDLKSRRPNILVFLTDDQAQWAQQSYGNPDVVSPNMAAIADRGVKMTQAFTTCPVCSPARASFFTGRMPSQHGIQDWLMETWYEKRNMLAGQTIISEPLKAAGYHTGLVGKWHCGACRIPKRAFDYWFSFWVAQYPHFGMQNFSNQGRHIQEYGNQSALLTVRALEFLKGTHSARRKNREPFFLFVGYTDTHIPHIQAPQQYVDYFNKQPLDWFKVPPFASCHGQIAGPQDGVPPLESEQHARLAQYYAAVRNIDHQVGEVVGAVKNMGVLDDTLVIYTGDHGLNGGHHGFWEKGNATTPQNFVDESIRIAAFLSWKNGGFARGATCDDLVSHPDLFMTILDAAQAIPSEAELRNINSPGRSYLRQLRGEKVTGWRDAMICEYGNARMIRNDHYKLILRYPYKHVKAPNELYDLKSDPQETQNIYHKPEHQDTIKALGARIDAFFKVYTVPGHSGLELEKQPIPDPNAPWIAMAQRDYQWVQRDY